MSSYSYLADLLPVEGKEIAAHTEVLVADSRVDQSRIRAAVDVVFTANPALGTVFEPVCDCWTARPGGGWSWAVEPPGDTVAEVVARQRAAFDIRTGRLFAVSLIPGVPERLVLCASHLCMDGTSWELLVDDLVRTYDWRVLAPTRAHPVAADVVTPPTQR